MRMVSLQTTMRGMERMNTNMRNQWIDIVKTAVDLALVTVLLILLWPVLKVLSFLF